MVNADNETCSHADTHSETPGGYLDRIEWAEAMMAKGYEPVRCVGCGLWKVWLPSKSLDKAGKRERWNDADS